MKAFAIIFTAAVVALFAIQWAALPRYPDTVSHQFEQHALDFVTRATVNVGLLFEYFNIMGPEHLLRTVYSIAGKLLRKDDSSDIKVLTERTKIGSTPVVITKPRQDNVNSGLLPGVIYFHGGAWTHGSPDTHLAFTSWMSKTAKMAVISVDYGLSPETTYEPQTDECVRIAKKVLADAENFGIDRNRIFIAGDSAGGALAASVSLILANASLKIRGTMLISPAVQAVNFTVPSYRSYSFLYHNPIEYDMCKRAGLLMTPGMQYAMQNGLHVPADILAKWNRDYLNVLNIPDYEFPSKGVNVLPPAPKVDYSSDLSKLEIVTKMALDTTVWPLFASDEALKALPPTLIQACELDFIRDDALLYAHRLRTLKVPVTLSYLRDALHDEPIMSFFLQPPKSDAAVKGLDDIANFLIALK